MLFLTVWTMDDVIAATPCLLYSSNAVLAGGLEPGGDLVRVLSVFVRARGRFCGILCVGYWTFDVLIYVFAR